MLLSVPTFPEISLVSILSGVNSPDNKETSFELYSLMEFKRLPLVLVYPT